MQCTLKQAEHFIPLLMKNNITPFLHGSPSSGKSSIVKQIADKYSLHLIDVRLSQIEPQDLLGLPNFDGDKVKYLPMDTFPIQGDKVPSGKKGWLLFLDEANGASHSVQMASYKLILDREVGNHKLHDKCFIVAAGNLDTDNAITNTLSSALISRMAHFYIDLNANDWLEWASDNGIDSRIIAYIGFKNGHLYQFNPDNTEPYSSPRTWEMLSRVIKDTEVTHELSPLLYSLIGNVQTEFIAFCKLFKEIPKYDDIIKNPENINISNDLGTQWALISMVTDHMDKKTAKQASLYLQRFSMELQIVAMRQLRYKFKDEFKTLMMKECKDWFGNTRQYIFGE